MRHNISAGAKHMNNNMKSKRTLRLMAALLSLNVLIAFGHETFAQSAPSGKSADANSNKNKNKGNSKDKDKDNGKKKDAQAEIFKVWMKGKNGVEKKKTTAPGTDDKPADGNVKLKNPGPGSGTTTPGGTTTTGSNRLLGSADRPSFVMSIVQFLGVMALMLGGFYYGMRFLKSRSNTMGGTGDLVRVIASVPLLQGKFLQIVDMAGKLLVLGVSDHGVNLIAEVEDARTADQIRIWDSRKSASPMPAGLMEQLTRVLKTTEYRFWNKGEKSSEQKPDFQTLFRGRGGVLPEEPVGAASPPAVSDASSMDSESVSGDDAGQNLLFQENAENQQDLEKLLSAQKRKLAAIKSRNQTG